MNLGMNLRGLGGGDEPQVHPGVICLSFATPMITPAQLMFERFLDAHSHFLCSCYLELLVGNFGHTASHRGI